jgi:uncharacterized protein (DUF427 family)
MSVPVRVELNGDTIASSDRALRVLETSSPPTIYIPADDVLPGVLRVARDATTTWCEWKGRASYLDVVIGDRVARRAAWTYPNPRPAYEVIAGYVSFYPGRVDACYIGSERVRPQAGGFYGGWITHAIVGPFKGEPGSEGW